MLHVVHYAFVPNTAATNRLISFLNNIPSNIDVIVYFLVPDSSFSKIELSRPNVNIYYCWDTCYKSSKLGKIVSIIKGLRLVRRSLKDGDVLYSYNTPSFLKLLKKKNIKVFSEKTEHPDIYNYASKWISNFGKAHIELCKSLEGLFVISTSLKEYYVSHGLKESHVHIINMTVDANRFQRLEKKKTEEKYIAYCGNASNNKDGVDKLLKSFQIVHKKYPKLKLYIIGKSPNPYVENNNINLSEDLGIKDSVVFTGMKDACEVPQLLMNADILLLNRPDSIQAKNGFPTKLGEYLMTGNPVVVTSVGDIPLFLNNEESAMIADSSDNQDFAEKILFLLDNPEIGRQIGEKGKEVALKNFDAAKETKKMIAVMLK